jgi:hypothetical protein
MNYLAGAIQTAVATLFAAAFLITRTKIGDWVNDGSLDASHIDYKTKKRKDGTFDDA